MSVNDSRPHIFVLPEDKANRDVANGFLLQIDTRQVQVLPSAGGWMRVLEKFENEYINTMSGNSHRHIVLLIDFDGKKDRRDEVQKVIPDSLSDRVFIIGALTEPEKIRKAGLGSFEEIGQKLADDCRDQTTTAWDHELLEHNAEEVKRMMTTLRPILFPPD